jgi:hypothetical protein
VNKLEYGKWIDWSDNEKSVIIDYLKNDWIDFVNNSSSQLHISNFEEYSKFIDLTELIQSWRYKNGGLALRKMVELIEYDGYAIFNSKKPIKIGELDCTEVFQDILLDSKLVSLLENDFFKYETTDKEYTDMISSGLQMIETEIKIRKNGR